jgi:hypothetical protein
VGVVLINAVFGALGYMIFGNNVEGLVISNIHGPVASIVKVLLSVDLLFTVPIVLSAPRRLLERALVPMVRGWQGARGRGWGRGGVGGGCEAARCTLAGMAWCVRSSLPAPSCLVVSCALGPLCVVRARGYSHRIRPTVC